MTDDQRQPLSGKPLAQMIAETRAQVATIPPLPAAQEGVVRGYRLLREIHRGGQGVVYLAHHAATGRDVAVKVMRQGPFARISDRARFEREIQILASIKHPNIIAIHDSGSENGNDFFVMDFIAGESFDHWADQVLNDQPGDSKQSSASARRGRDRIVQAFIKISDAVAVAHQRGIIHRDLKPSNIRVDEHGEPHVLDFGLAKTLPSGDTEDGGRHLTVTGQFVGTLPWASPEQLADSATVADTRGDVYALGLVLYRALAGRMPYPAQAGITDMVRVITESEPERLSKWSSGIDFDLETIVLKCLGKSPERRYPSAAELADDLRRFVCRQPIRARPDTTWYTLRMFASRNKLAVAALSGFIALLITSSVALALLYARANQRAEETRRVLEFQAAQLSEVEPDEMGQALRELVLSQVDQYASPPITAAEELVAGGGKDHRRLLEQANFTNIAVELLDKSIFTRTLTAIDNQFADEPLLRAKMLHTLSETMFALGLYEQGLVPAREAVSVRQRTLGRSHPDTLASRTNLGKFLLAVGQTDQAEPLLTDVLQISEAKHGRNHPLTLATRKDLGEVQFQRGRYEQALELFDEAAENLLSVLGEEHEQTLMALGGKAKTLQKLERLDDAQALNNRLLEIATAKFGEQSAHVHAIRNNLAAICFQRGKYDEAIALFRQILTTARTRWGDNHYQTMILATSLARVLISAGKAEEALPMLEAEVKRHKTVFGSRHDSTLNTMSMLAQAYSLLGRQSEAVRLQAEVVEGYRSTLGSQHPHTGRVLGGYGIALERTKQWDAAEQAFREALEISRAALGNNHTETLLAIGNLGGLLQQRDRLEEAESLLKEAVAGYQALGTLHPHMNVFMRRLAVVLRKRGKLKESLEMAQTVLDDSVQIYGEDHPMTERARALTRGILTDMERVEHVENSTDDVRPPTIGPPPALND